jgi:large subunit ribosomal protein L24
MNSLRIKKGDMVKVVAGSHKGKTGKVVSTDAKSQSVTIEGIGLVKRHVKPTQINPRGGTKEIHNALPVSNVVLLVGEKEQPTRVGYQTAKDGSKVRVAKQLKNKEIK